MDRLRKKIEPVLGINLTYLVRKGFSVSLMYAVLAIIGFCSTVILARFLTPDLYGKYQYIIALAGILSFLALPGMNMAAMKESIAGHFHSVLSATRYSFLASLLASLVLLAIALYDWNTANDPEIFWSLILLSVAFPFYYAFNTWYVFFAAQEDFQSIAWRSVVFAFVPAVFVGIGAYLGQSPKVLVGFFFTVGAIVTIAIYLDVRKRILSMAPLSSRPLDVRYGIWVTAQKMTSNLSETLPPIVIAALFTYREVALFQIAFFTIGIFSSYLGALIAIYIPKLFTQLHLDHRKILFNAFFAGVWGFCGVAIFLKFLFPVFFGPAYSESLRLAWAFSSLAVLFPLKTYLVNYYTTAEKNLRIILVYSIANFGAIVSFFVFSKTDFLVASTVYVYALNLLIVVPLGTFYAREIASEKTRSS